MALATTSLGNTPVSYGGVAKTFHWLTALLILTAIPLGLIANALPFETSAQLATKAWVFSLHKTVGVAAFFTALARIAWAVSQPKPGLLHPQRRLESFAAETVHWLLYASLVIVPLSGWIHHAATAGFAPIWWPFGQSLPLVPKSEALAETFAALHTVFTKVLGLSVLLHIAGALKHHLVDRDATLRRMLPGRVGAQVPPQAHSAAPALAASGIYALALAIGLALASGSHSAVAPAVPGLAAKPTGWTVQEGTLEISVQQLGSAVTGRFSDWQAAIEFDPEAEGPVMGRVDVDVALNSLSLGSVTRDALSPEFLDAESHPVATFSAEIVRASGPTSFEAAGTLALKGVETPARLPFEMTLSEDTARVSGNLVLDRRDFGIGTASYNDEASVGFDVGVSVDLVAERTR